ncbi:hypothetical protein ESA94_08050 [Lacibacter luteus]|uniref:Uncharacterized protein n=1 Tax=Lacibacter luteus TaxID=2508719 RepID=A0A4Q1CIP8_9BACT|nr:hypothetical protein [Lacibacter luteus]RXK60413.1 hypothetical protein ESA94_08050 [Lacibacter luteus]
MCAYKRKTWIEKRDISNELKVEVIDKDFADMKKGEKMLVATPLIVDEYIRHIPKGKEGSLAQMRKDLAAEYHADKTCPITSGIFVRIVAEAAYEEYEKGKAISKIAPFWRIINEKSPAAKKLTFGTDFLLEQRRKEKLDKPTVK